MKNKFKNKTGKITGEKTCKFQPCKKTNSLKSKTAMRPEVVVNDLLLEQIEGYRR